MDVEAFWVIVCCEDSCEYFEIVQNVEEARSIANVHREAKKHSLKMVPIEGRIVIGGQSSHD